MYLSSQIYLSCIPASCRLACSCSFTRKCLVIFHVLRDAAEHKRRSVAPWRQRSIAMRSLALLLPFLPLLTGRSLLVPRTLCFRLRVYYNIRLLLCHSHDYLSSLLSFVVLPSSVYDCFEWYCWYYSLCLLYVDLP